MEPLVPFLLIGVFAAIASGSVGYALSAREQRTFEQDIRETVRRAGLELVGVRVPGMLETLDHTRARSGHWRTAEHAVVPGPDAVRVELHVGDPHHHHDARGFEIRHAEVRDRAGRTHPVWVAVRLDGRAADLVLFDWPLDRLGDPEAR